ncbi:MAG TPA: glycosyl hydrolase family 18 protein [Micromonosporaceae bacterium]|nr:glycosyl hydrolase family 18 protein [Micromonosporaceae bacterium]
MTVGPRVVMVAAAMIAAAALGGCSPDRSSRDESPADRFPPDQPSPAARISAIAGYVVPWDERSPAAAASVEELTEVNPVWFQPTDSGGVAFASDTAELDAQRTGSQRDRMAPTISNFRNGAWDGELVARLVGDENRRAVHVAAITTLVRDGGWRGVDIDYESLPEASRDAYSAFIRELAAALHALPTPARLSVALHAKTAEPGDWHGSRAQDWAAIGAAADEVRLMAYDHATASSAPGPIAPLSWVERVFTLATASIPLDRISAGLPTYGYDWAQHADGVAVQWADVQAIASQHGATPQWDQEASAPWLRYVDVRGREHTVWYEDGRALAAKLDLARRHGISRVALWRLGGEDPAAWSALNAAR